MVLLVIPAGSITAGLLAFTTNWIALIKWRRSAGQHWTERARLLWPARVGARLNLLLIPAAGVVAGIAFNLRQFPSLTALGIAAWLGAVAGTYPFDREVLPWLQPRDWFHQVFASWTLRLSWLALIFTAALIMPVGIGWRGIFLFVLVSALHLWLVLGLNIRLLRLLGILQPPTGRLERIVAETAQRMSLPTPRVWVIQIAASNALAMPSNNTLLFSSRLLELHPDDEISAICAHELAHLSESRRVRAARVLTSMSVLPLLFLKPALADFDQTGPLAILAMAITFLGIRTFGRRLGRRMEVRADRIAAENQINEGVYARALERIYESNQVPAVMRGKRMTHPHLYDRLVAAGLTPSYPRPKPPESTSINLLVIATALGVLLGIAMAKYNG